MQLVHRLSAATLKAEDLCSKADKALTDFNQAMYSVMAVEKQKPSFSL